MSVGWDSLPLLPLCGILDHLSLKDALNTTTVCRHWRNALLIYEGHKEVLKLYAKKHDRSMFLARLFRKHVRRLHIYIDCGEEQLDKLFNVVLPEFFDTLNLTEITFIGPSYFTQNLPNKSVKLKRVITESLVYKHSHCLKKFAMFGCHIGVATEEERYMHKRTEYYSRPLVFDDHLSPEDGLLSRSNAHLMAFSKLHHILLDYEQLTPTTPETLSSLPHLSWLSISIGSGAWRVAEPVDWSALQTHVHVAANIIGLHESRFDDVIEQIFVEGMPLVSLKVFFCKTLYSPLIAHVVRCYKQSLRCLVWVDAPHPCADRDRICGDHTELCNINPFILLCWQCVNLKKLVIHGYWVWQYDVLGFVRLRKSLQQLEVSAVYGRPGRAGLLAPHDLAPECFLRVAATDRPRALHPAYLQEVSSLRETPWAPLPWSRLPPALTARSTPAHRHQYVIHHTRHIEDIM